jgi:uncharacterized protein YgiM (DUF1202 family)
MVLNLFFIVKGLLCLFIHSLALVIRKPYCSHRLVVRQPCHSLTLMINFPNVSKLKIISITIVVVALVIAGAFFTIEYLNPESAGILVDTQPESIVYIDDTQVGRTPYESTRKPGEVLIKLVPESFEKPLAPYETKVNLASGIKTIIQRDFAATEEESSGVIVSFEKVGGDEASISVVSMPDSAQILIDGKVMGFSPIKTSSLAEGEHPIEVTADGYNSKSLLVRTQRGYKLTAFFKLSPKTEEERDDNQEEVKGEEEEAVPQIEILPTPTGFLRVRSEPSTLATEVGQVKPGDVFGIQDEDERTGWFKIEYEEGEMGWVTSQYVKKVNEEEAGESPSPSPTTTP